MIYLNITIIFLRMSTWRMGLLLPVFTEVITNRKFNQKGALKGLLNVQSSGRYYYTAPNWQIINL